MLNNEIVDFNLLLDNLEQIDWRGLVLVSGVVALTVNAGRLVGSYKLCRDFRVKRIKPGKVGRGLIKMRCDRCKNSRDNNLERLVYGENGFKISDLYVNKVVGNLQKITDPLIIDNVGSFDDLEKIIMELEKYGTNEEVMTLLVLVDLLYHYLNKLKGKRLLVVARNNLERGLREVNNLLFKMYITKIKQELNSGRIDYDEFVELASGYAKGLITELVVGNKVYGKTSTQEVFKSMMTVLSEALNSSIEAEEVKVLKKV